MESFFSVVDCTSAWATLKPRIEPIEWKGYDWLVGHRPYDGPHREREPNRFDDPDSYEDLG
ncbi:hypothetical protein [Nocardioides sp. zg-1228]|uniref:hypothetical protein n=1 Tax=Nocardioides sp. zg-1228 TaxID=2763008 RepID=UPI001642B1B4|nr:hypothetical protein [Nocardioides sp. zg-1228]MBC2932878.1 hypothetical protein [Nocardioides sp. zg-1228]QSF56914.1 hypothetical protein JX575_15160 [Nocardioides sp. zg-1228]